MGLIRRSATAFLLALAVLLLITGTALGETEPVNNRFTGADGPLMSDVTVNASLNAIGDEDWYYFYVGATGNFTVANTAYTVFYQYDGGSLRELWYMEHGTSTPRQLEPGLYYIRVYKDHPPIGYALKVVGPTSAYAPNKANTHRSATEYSEIYESATEGYKRAQLVAPYAENHATYDADGDRDWYKFYVTGTCAVTVGQWAPKNTTLCVYANPTQPEIVWFNGFQSATTTRQLGPGIYYVMVYGVSPPQEYTFTVRGAYVSLDKPSVLSIPSVVGRARATRTTKFTGRISPARAASINVEMQRFSGGKYRGYKVVRVRASAQGSWSVRKRLKRGTYRVRAKASAATGYASGVSGWRKVVVR